MSQWCERRLLRVAVVWVGVLLLGCQPSEEASTVAFRVPVTVAPVVVETVEEVIVTTGTLRAPSVITLTVMTEGLLQIGRGEQGRLAEGDRVTAGQVIASITGEDVRLAARRQVAEKKLAVAEQNFAASSVLWEKKLVSVAAYGQDKTAYEEAKHEYERSLHSESRNQMVTPIDGVILQLARDQGQAMANGQLVKAGQVIAQIAPLGSLVAEVDVVGGDIARVSRGLRARVQHHAWGERTFSGEVVRLSPTIDEQTRALRAVVSMDNGEGLLRPGMFVTVSLVAQRREAVPVIPRRALAQRGGRRVVFVVSGQRAQRREVSLGLGDEAVVEVREGVSVGESVVVLGLQTLSDQMPVRVTGS